MRVESRRNLEKWLHVDVLILAGITRCYRANDFRDGCLLVRLRVISVLSRQRNYHAWVIVILPVRVRSLTAPANLVKSCGTEFGLELTDFSWHSLQSPDG